MLDELSEEAKRHADQENWGQYRNVRYDTAVYVREQGNWKRAGFLYLEVLVFDLQGVTSALEGGDFHEAHSVASPAVVNELARMATEHEFGESEIKTVYDRVADQAWMDRFPRSREEVWEEIRAAVLQQRDAIRLTEKVESLGANQLLKEEEADTFIECKNEYEIIRRVETLLENEDPTGVPPKKAKRVKTYLAALDPESLESRWKAKVYRRGGEVMLSQGGKQKALQYFERALEAADQDELGEVERIVKALRSQLKEAPSEVSS